MPVLRRRSCPATARPPICSGRMTHPAPLRPAPVPSISRLFAAAFLAIAVAGLAERVAIWRSARRTQADMIELSQRLEQLARLSPSPALEPEIVAMRERAAARGERGGELRSRARRDRGGDRRARAGPVPTAVRHQRMGADGGAPRHRSTAVPGRRAPAGG